MLRVYFQQAMRSHGLCVGVCPVVFVGVNDGTEAAVKIASAIILTSEIMISALRVIDGCDDFIGLL